VVIGGKVSASVKRLAIGSEEGRERPPPLPGQGADRGLITAVDIGAFVAIHLYGDETLVNDLGYFRIVVGLAVHHVAPMAPHRADVEQHGLVLALSQSKCLFTPFTPLDRLMHGGTEIRRGRPG